MVNENAIFWPPVAHAERLAGGVVRLAAAEEISATEANAGALRLLGERRAPAVDLVLDETLASQAYRVDITAEGARIIGGDGAGLFYGALTFCQWIEAEGRREGQAWLVPPLHVEDHPEIAVRGVMLDISRDRVPTMETLFALVEQLACLKVNQLQLYIEHAFAYAGHEAVWRDASPMTAAELRQLDAYCRARHISLVPNQNSLGHFHRWLIHDDYRPLAECPEGIEHPFSQVVEPYGLCVTDERVFALLEELYEQLLSAFSARDFNVGLDEAFDLGRCRSAEACAARGKQGLFFDYLRRVYALLQDRGRGMQCWADMFQSSPEVIAALPADVTALVWGYSAEHEFDAYCANFAAAGKPFYVCPGTSSWNSFLGRNSVALSNLQRAAQAAALHGASGYLVTDWGDNGHLQPLPASYFGLVAGAALGWAPHAPLQRIDVGRALSRHLFGDAAGGLGEALARLGDAHESCGPRLINSAYPFNFVVRHGLPLDAPALSGVSEDSLESCEEEIEAALADMARASSSHPDAGLVKRELGWGAGLLRLGCRIGRARLAAEGPVEAIDSAQRRRFASDLEALIGEHEALWLARSRVGGMKDSRQRLEGLRARLEA